MYSDFEKDDDVYLVAQEAPLTDSYFIHQGSVWKKGRNCITVSVKGMELAFKNYSFVSNDLFGRSYTLFKTKQEAETCLKTKMNKKYMKEKILNVISILEPDELEDIYFYLEARYPEEMR